jgi:hypothetical protein
MRFDDGQRLVDVGGGSGELLLHILQSRPSLRGVIYDRAHARSRVRNSASNWRMSASAASSSPQLLRRRTPGGRRLPAQERAAQLGRSARARHPSALSGAMGSTARLLIVERMAPERWEANAAHQAWLNRT